MILSVEGVMKIEGREFIKKKKKDKNESTSAKYINFKKIKTSIFIKSDHED